MTSFGPLISQPPWLLYTSCPPDSWDTVSLVCGIFFVFFVMLQAYFIGIGASICTGRESWFLLYAFSPTRFFTFIFFCFQLFSKFLANILYLMGMSLTLCLYVSNLSNIFLSDINSRDDSASYRQGSGWHLQGIIGHFPSRCLFIFILKDQNDISSFFKHVNWIKMFQFIFLLFVQVLIFHLNVTKCFEDWTAYEK